jgi:hypothetical protein
MIRRFLILGLALAALPSGKAAEPKASQPVPVLLEKANVLPLALDDTFEFRKQKLFLNDPDIQKPTNDRMINFERLRLNYGAVSAEEQKQRYGHYLSFWWRATRPANVTVRLEYRQANLGNHVQAQEVSYAVGKGTHQTDFKVIGDSYIGDGVITAWRALVIEDGKIVALKQSYLWH